MSALRPLRTALGVLTSDPVLFGAGALFGLLSAASTVATYLLPRVVGGAGVVSNAMGVVSFLVTPFLVAGLFGMAGEAVDGDTGFGTFLSVGRDRYLPLLLGSLVELLVVVAFSFVFGIATAVAVFAGVAGSGGFTPAGLLVPLALVAVAVGIPFAVVMFLIQFFDVAIVVDELGVTDGFRRSYGLVRRNLLSALGFTAIALLVGFLTSLPATGLFAYRFYRRYAAGGFDSEALAESGNVLLGLVSPAEAAGLAVLSLVLVTVVRTFVLTYKTAFYRDHRPSAGPDDT